MSKAIPLHYQIADEVMELVKQGTHRSSVQERLNNGTIELVSNEIKSFQTTGEIFISSADIYTGLSLAAMRLVIQIQQELVMNNPLWECTEKNSSKTRGALAQLKKAGIIKPILGTDIYLVNPLKIRKGKPLSVYGSLYEYAKRMYIKDPRWKPTTEDIRRLKAPEKLSLPTITEKELL